MVSKVKIFITLKIYYETYLSHGLMGLITVILGPIMGHQGLKGNLKNFRILEIRRSERVRMV